MQAMRLNVRARRFCAMTMSFLNLDFDLCLLLPIPSFQYLPFHHSSFFDSNFQVLFLSSCFTFTFFFPTFSSRTVP